MATKRRASLSCLPVGDSLLPRLRRVALTSEAAHAWLLESAKQWALVEFLRREERREEMGYSAPHGLENEVACQVGHQVAVRTAWREISGSPAIFGRPVADRYAVKVGLLRPGSEVGYITMLVSATESFAGMMEVGDIVEIHPDFRVRAWPTRYTANEPKERTRG